mgnify:CR=1 FL=1
MTYSRVKKYQELRDGLKEEVGISKEKYVEPVQNDGDDDDFLSFMKKDKEEKEVNLEDTLTETKTFEQMREEGSAELDKALKSAKESVGKQDQYNTRMDILSKIREPEKNTIKIDSVESYATQEFAKGMFVNNEVEEDTVEVTNIQEETAVEEVTVDVNEDNKVVTTEDELEGFNIVRSILSEVVSAEEISYKDVERYFGILYQNNTRKWVCRLYFNSAKKSITIADENKKEVRYYIENISDIYKYKNELLSSIYKYIETVNA